MMRRSDEAADLSSTDDSTLEMNQSEREELWDLLAFLKTSCKRVLKREKHSLHHITETTALCNTACKYKIYFLKCSFSGSFCSAELMHAGIGCCPLPLNNKIKLED